MKESNIFSKASYYVKDFFNHWNTPPKEDYHVSNKEFVCYSVGGMGVQGFGILTQYTAIVMGAYLSVAYNFDQWVVQITGWVMAILAIFRAPLLGFLVDNTNTKYGRFRPYLLWAGFVSTGILSMLAYLPNLFMGTPNAKWTVVIVYQLIYFAGMTTFSLFSYGRIGLAQVITPNTKERTKLYSIGGVIDSLGPSAVQLFFPLIAGAVTGGMNDIRTFQILIPIFGVILAGLSLLMVFGTKERMQVAKGKKLHVKFFTGIKKSFKNKYFWMFNISTVMAFGRLAIFSTSIYIAKNLIGGSVGDTIFALMSTVLGVAFIPGMALAPLIIKKIGKRNMTILSFAGSGGISVIMLLLSIFAFDYGFTPWVLYVGLFLHNIFASLFTVTSPAMTADYCDYQQWKTGDRLDGFFSNFSTVILTVFSLATGALVTWALTSIGAIDANSYADLTVLRKAFILWGILGIVCAVLAIIPFIFWDLTEEKHKQIMDEVTKRMADEDEAADKLAAADGIAEIAAKTIAGTPATIGADNNGSDFDKADYNMKTEPLEEDKNSSDEEK